MMKVKKKKKGKDSEAPDSLSGDSLKYSEKQPALWNKYNESNPQFDPARSRKTRPGSAGRSNDRSVSF